MSAWWTAAGGGVALGALLSALVYRLISPPNERHERKCARLKGELKLLCPHGELTIRDSKTVWESWFISPHNTLWWGCQKCGQLVNTERQVDEAMKRQMDGFDAAVKNNVVKQWVVRDAKNRAACMKLIKRLVKAGCDPSSLNSADRRPSQASS